MTTSEKQPGEFMKLIVPSQPKYLYVIRSALYPLVLDTGFAKPEARKIILAVDEACSNIIKYAYGGDGTKQIEVRVAVDERKMVIELADWGKKPDVSKIAPRKLEDIRPGGLGTHFMASVFDRVSYDTSGEQGTILTLVKEKH
jgi:anti-sigma regulatory factor (Ser/Thr protein kinase)